MKNTFIVILSLGAIFFIFLTFPPIRFESKKVSQDSVFSCETDNLSGAFEPDSKLAVFEGKKIGISEMAFSESTRPVLGSTSESKWIEVDLSEQKLIAREGDSVFLETAVSTGLPATPTPKGEFRIWIKLRSARMQGGQGKYYYNLPNVPYVMYFSNPEIPGRLGYGLHGAYWHNAFGTVRSHGCVNLPIPVAERLYFWVTPNTPEGKGVVKSTSDNPGTRIVIHE